MARDELERLGKAGKPGHITHGIHSWLRSGKVNPSVRGHRRIQRYLREIKSDLIRDLGGPENLTAAKEVLVEATIQAYGVLLLAGAYTQRYSILDPVRARRGILELQPVLGHQYIAFLNCIRQNLMALGLDKRKTEEVLTPYEVIAREEREAEAREAKVKTAGQGKARVKDGRKAQDKAPGPELSREDTAKGEPDE